MPFCRQKRTGFRVVSKVVCVVSIFFSFLRQSDIESDSARLVAVFLFSDDHHPPGYTWEVGPGPTLQTDFKLGCCVGRVSLCRT